MQSDDPEDMELLRVEVKDTGLFLFECDDAHELSSDIDAAKARSGAKVSARLLV